MKNQVFNPYLPSYEYIPDGEPRIFGNRLYIYGSHDKFGSTQYCDNDYVCWSTPVSDLSDWRYEGTIYTREDHPCDEIHERTCLYAPDVVLGNDGRYYLYYSMSGSSIISVAVCDTPAGHFAYLGDVHSPDHALPIGYCSGDYYQFDPSVLVDDDGRIYLYSGYAPKASEDNKGRLYVGCHAYELESDMLTVKQGPVLFIPKEWHKEEGAAYFEAPSMRKINGLYYFVYSARATGLYYYYSTDPLHDPHFGGRIHSTSDVGIHGYDAQHPAYPIGNIHGGIACINGQYYIFDHRHTNRSSYQRQGVAEPIFFDEKGLIAQAEATSCGLNNAPLRGTGTYPAYIACYLFYPGEYDRASMSAYMTQDVDDIYSTHPLCSGNEYQNMETIENPIQYLHGINDSVTFGYKYFDFDHEVSYISCKVRGHAKGTLSLSLEENAQSVGTLDLELDSSCWTTVTVPCRIDTGIHALYFKYHGKGEFDMLNFTFSSEKKG